MIIELLMDNSWTSVRYPDRSGSLEKIVDKALHEGLGVKESYDQLRHNKAYQMGYYDGIIKVYDDKGQRFPTGLVEEAEKILGELQAVHTFQFKIIDDRPDPLLVPEDIPEEIQFTDSDSGDLITLRDYQMEAINDVVANRDGVLHLSTGCVTADTNILTTEGYMSFSEILEQAGIPENSEEGYKGNPTNIKLINKIGKVETPTDITVNGIKETKLVTTERGYAVQATDTHPLQVVTSTGAFEWRNVEDLKIGDWLVLRKGDGIVGSEEELTEEDAYMLGMLIADAYLGSETKIDFTNSQKELLNFYEDYFNNKYKRTINSKIKDSRNNTYSYVIQDVEFVPRYKKDLGLSSVLSKDKEVPYRVRNASREVQLAFISGYFECEMYINSKKGKGIEVVSASEKLLRQIQNMLLNLGIVATLREKEVKGYEQNWYGRLMIGAEQTAELLSLLTLKTEERKKSRREFYEVFNSKSRNNQGQRVPFGKELANKYYLSSKTPYGQRAVLRKHFHTPKYISKVRLKKGLEKYPDGDEELLNRLHELVKDEYEFSKIFSIEEMEAEPTFDFHMPETNSYIAEGIVNHNSGKTYTTAGLITVAKEHLHAGERIGFFVHKRDLFKQTYDVLSSALPDRIGRIESGRMDPELVNVVMVPTAASALSIDVEKGLRFTPKQMVIKKMATIITPEYTNGVNQRMLLTNYAMNMELKTKADEAFKAEIEKVVAESESDAKAIFNLNAYTVLYNNLLKEKNADKFKKKKEMEEFLETIVMGVFDEAHSVQAEGYYTVALACENALMKVGLTGSIDTKNELLVKRMQGVFHDVASVTRNVEMIDRGVLADTEVMIVPIDTVIHQGKKINTQGYDWQDAYEYGISLNEYRNALASKIAQQWEERGEVVLIVVNRIEHGENISQMLDSLGVAHEYIHGESEQEHRNETIRRVREGELNVLLSSTIIDEGIDIPRLSVLINAAGYKSLRMVLQRSGRILRKKADGGRARIIDFEDNTNKYLRRHSLERQAIYKDEQFPMSRME